MGFSTASELPSAVREALPDPALHVFCKAANDALAAGGSEERCFGAAWSAVRSAGWRPPECGEGPWVKQHQPSGDATHVDTPLGSGRKRRRKTTNGSEASAVAAKAGGEPVELFIEVAKDDDGNPAVQEDERLAFGWLSVVEEDGQAVVDLQDHVIEPAELEKAAYGFVLDSRVAGEMHKTIGVGALVESMVFTKEKQAALGIDLGKVGWWVGFKLDSDTFAKVKSGDLRAFSIGGRGVLEDVPEVA